MTTTFSEVLEILTLLLGGWVAIFGGVGALYARRRSYSPLKGLLCSGIAGPFGWMYIWACTRAVVTPSYRFEDDLDDEWSKV